MDELLRSTLVKVALPVVAIVVVLGITKWRGISWREDLGFRKPTLTAVLGWVGFWILWILASEVLIRTFGLAQAKPWPDYPPMILALRIAAIGVLGPFAEEIVMRGGVLSRLRRTRLGPLGAVVVVAVAWAALHYQYGPATLALVAADGVVFGLARQYGGSLWLPVAMHTIGNLASIYQSISG
jgi:membrane protease YdiL (CAAX protease family)